MQEGANWDERNNDIVGFKREKIENLNSAKKLTVK
jgi:hypothetical protein